VEGPEIVPGVVVAETVITLVTVAVPQGPVTVSEIVTVPAATPVTTPEDEPTVATLGLLVLHMPDAPEESVRVIVEPAHTVVGPVILEAVVAITVTVLCIVQPPRWYMIDVVPAWLPVTTPEDEPTVAT
jgi:hypothetical protein